MRTSLKAFWDRSYSRRIGLVMVLSFWGILGLGSVLEYRQEKATLVTTVTDHAVIQLELSRPSFAEKVRYGRHFELWKEIRRLIEITQQRNSLGALLKIQEIAVLDNEGRVLGHSAPDKNPLLKAYAGNVSRSNSLSDGLTTHWNADKPRFSVTANLSWDNQPVGLLYVDYTTKNLQTSLQALFNWQLLLMGLAGLLAFVLSIVFARWFTKPLNSVIPVLGEIGKGTLSLPKFHQREDEFGTLARALEAADRRIHLATGDLHEEIEARHDIEMALSAFKTTLDITLDCVFMFEADTLRFCYVNQGAMKQVGYSEQELFQLAPFDIKPEFDEARFRNMVEPLIHGDDHYTFFETIHQHKDGHKIPVEISMQYIETAEISPRFIAIVRDISERRKAENEQKRLMSMLEAAPDLVSMADTEGRILFVNAAGREQLGEGPEADLGGCRICDFHSKEVTQHIMQEALPTAQRDGKWRGETLFRRRDGSEFVTSQVITAHFGENGEVTHFSTIARDISSEKAVEHELRHYQANLELMVKIRTCELEAEKDKAEAANNAKSEFLSRMSHELRTPMNSVLGFAQLLEADANENLSTTQQENVQEILDAGRHLLTLINEVLDLSRIDSGHMDISLEKVHLAEVVQASVKLVQLQASNRAIRIVDAISECDDVVVCADFTRLRQVLVNLLNNAVKYNREGGGVTVSGRVEGDMLHLDITDTGKGIRDEDLCKLFVPFERLDAKHNVEGTGIGLAISQHLVEIMRGKLSVRSHYGEGSTFSVELPLFERCWSEEGEG